MSAAELSELEEVETLIANGRRLGVLTHAELAQAVSEFDLDAAFKSYVDKNKAPGITAIGLGIDTSKAGRNGTAAALLKSIEFVENDGAPTGDDKGSRGWSQGGRTEKDRR